MLTPDIKVIVDEVLQNQLVVLQKRFCKIAKLEFDEVDFGISAEFIVAKQELNQEFYIWINMYGRYRFDFDADLEANVLRFAKLWKSGQVNPAFWVRRRRDE